MAVGFAVAGSASAMAVHRCLGGGAPESVRVSQRNRAFLPSTLSIAAGQRVAIVNDDAPRIHHAYVDAPGLDFDSGDQLPGAVSEIAFDAPGTYQVLCGIHPAMRITVEVRSKE